MSLLVSGAACHLRLKKEKKGNSLQSMACVLPPSVLCLMTPGLRQKILTNWTGTLLCTIGCTFFWGGEGGSIKIFLLSLSTSLVDSFEPYSISNYCMKLLNFIALSTPVSGIMCYEIHKRISCRFRCSP